MHPDPCTERLMNPTSMLSVCTRGRSIRIHRPQHSRMLVVRPINPALTPRARYSARYPSISLPHPLIADLTRKRGSASANSPLHYENQQYDSHYDRLGRRKRPRTELNNPLHKLITSPTTSRICVSQFNPHSPKTFTIINKDRYRDAAATAKPTTTDRIHLLEFVLLRHVRARWPPISAAANTPKIRTE